MKQLLAGLLLALTGSALLAQDTSTNWTELNLAVTDSQILPAYRNFATVTASLVPAANALCADPGTDSFAALQQSFHQSMDAWESIQHVQFGPITYFNWNFRLHYWPDEKASGPRELAALIAGRDAASLQADSFARQSVRVQGFPALELLLFDADSLQLLQEDKFRCQVLQTIANNISSIAAGISTAWQDEFRREIANADDSDFFEDAQDATVELYKALEETVRKNQQQKLEAVLGESFATARVRRAESWRSERSLRNIKLNVTALQQLFAGSSPALSSALLPEDVETVSAAFARLQTDLEPLPDSMVTLLQDESGYQQLKTVRDDMDAVFEALEAALKNTDLYLGFNSLDGD